jgi:hypothetical protein
LADDWLSLAGTLPPNQPLSAQTYSALGLPWYNLDVELPAVSGASALAEAHSINALVSEKVGLGLADNTPIHLSNIIQLS